MQELEDRLTQIENMLNISVLAESMQESNQYYCSTNPTRNETCVCLSGTERTCYYETCGSSPYGVCTSGEWVKI